MSSKPKAVVSWSSGKDSAWSYHIVQQAGDYDIVGLVTTLTKPYERIAMHGVREALVDQQAVTLNLPCHKVWLPTSPCPNAVYEEVWGEVLQKLKQQGVTHVIFGDLFLEDIRAYRERQMAELGLTPVFPLWGEDTKVLAHKMIEGGLRARLTCIDSKKLDKSFAGRVFDETFLKDLPDDIDPCGERGEFHTFVYDAPFFPQPLPVRLGEIVDRDGFSFADVLL